MNLPKNCTRFDQKQQKVCVLMCFVVRVWPKILFYFSLWASWLHENNTDNIFQSPTGGSGIPESGSFTGNAFGIEPRFIKMFYRRNATKFKIMRIEKVITNYSNLTDYELATLGGRVVQAMQSPQAADFYANPQPETEELESLVEDYVRKHEIASRRGSALEISLKNESRQALLTALRTLGNYVNEKARGQLSYLLSSGLHLYASQGRNTIPGVPQNLRL